MMSIDVFVEVLVLEVCGVVVEYVDVEENVVELEDDNAVVVEDVNVVVVVELEL